MELIQQQISALTHKVDRVYQILDRLQQHVVLDLDAHGGSGAETSIKHPFNRDDSHRTNHDPRRVGKEWIVAHQDILIDSSGVEIGHHQIVEQELAPQIQIQRLTAQLTAAYSRIAALEEQLLARRWK
jgi:hypothetical protein